MKALAGRAREAAQVQRERGGRAPARAPTGALANSPRNRPRRSLQRQLRDLLLASRPSHPLRGLRSALSRRAGLDPPYPRLQRQHQPQLRCRRVQCPGIGAQPPSRVWTRTRRTTRREQWPSCLRPRSHQLLRHPPPRPPWHLAPLQPPSQLWQLLLLLGDRAGCLLLRKSRSWHTSMRMRRRIARTPTCPPGPPAGAQSVRRVGQPAPGLSPGSGPIRRMPEQTTGLS
mmetsp:Transcript_8424/g.23957  ORF Transcript_8424/g.23957 Transcript_8424/m.23957 type:complete len:229 (-) Transcript_8424:339-1025(-)